MLPAPVHIISDTHIGYAPAEIERSLVGFLRALPARGGSLLINGDLFEFWFEWKHVVPKSGVRVLAALMDLRDAGYPVTMLAGNHDCWGGDVLREAGVDYEFGPLTGDLGGWSARVEHGDGLRSREDRGYRAIRPILRSSLSMRAYRLLHPDFASWLAMGSSRTSRNYTPADDGKGLRDVATAALAADPSLELVVFGHSHAAALERIAGGGVYANAGSWLDAPQYLVLTPERIALREWRGSVEGPDLHALDRVAEKALP